MSQESPTFTEDNKPLTEEQIAKHAFGALMFVHLSAMGGLDVTDEDGRLLDHTRKFLDILQQDTNYVDFYSRDINHLIVQSRALIEKIAQGQHLGIDQHFMLQNFIEQSAVNYGKHT